MPKDNKTCDLEREIRRFMLFECGKYETATELAEAAAITYDVSEWLDDETHSIWDWALCYVSED